jgi:hypothetical protein
MFGIKTQKEKDLQSYADRLRDNLSDEKYSKERIEQSYELKIKDLESEHGLELKEKEFEMRHLKDEEVKKAKEEVVEISKKLAVLTKENEMLKSITDVNADIIDVKDLMNKLVEKLPSIDLKSLTIQNTGKE